MIGAKIQLFLTQRLKNNNLSRKEFAEVSQIPYPTITDLMVGNKSNPSLQTIVKIAECFSCSIDEIVGRNDRYQLISNIIVTNNPEQMMSNLRNYLKQKIENKKLRVYTLGRTIGVSNEAVANFIKDESNQKSVGSATIVKLADYFNVSIDEMIGRIKLDENREIDTEKENNNFAALEDSEE